MRISTVHLVVILGIFTIVHAALFLVYGIRDLHDSKGYIEAAQTFINQQYLPSPDLAFYFVPVCLLVISIQVFSDPAIPFIVTQIALFAFAVIRFYDACCQLFGARSAIFSVLMVLLWWDNVQWNSTVMTETLFVSVMMFLTHAIVFFDGTRRAALLITLLLILSMLTRPTGIVAVCGAGLWFLTNYRRQLIDNRLRLAVIVIACAGGAVLFASFLFERWDFTEQFVKGNVVTVVDLAAGKFNIDGLRVPPRNTNIFETHHSSFERFMLFIWYNPMEFLEAFFLKVLLLLCGFRPYYSHWHNTVIVLWTSAISVFALIGFRKCRVAGIRAFALATILTNCFLVGISSVDWDNRFYIPMQSSIVLLAGYGFSVMLSSFRALFARWISQ